MPNPAFPGRPQRLLPDDRAPRQEQPGDARAPAGVHDLRPEERIPAGPRPACFHRATLTRPGPLAPRLGACTTAVRHEDLLFLNEPAAGAAEDYRAIAGA